MYRFLIFDESGTCLFNLQLQRDKKDDIFDEHLVSSFLTALGNFSDAIFDEKIQQINYKQLSLVLISYPLEEGNKRLIGVAVASLKNTPTAIQRTLYDLLDEFVKGNYYKPHFKSKSFEPIARRIINKHIFGRTGTFILLGALNFVLFSLIGLYIFLFLPRPYDTLSMPLLFVGSILSGFFIGSKKVAILTITPLSMVISCLSLWIAAHLAALDMVVPIAYPETLFFMVFGLSMTGALLGAYVTEYLYLYPPLHKQHRLYKVKLKNPFNKHGSRKN